MAGEVEAIRFDVGIKDRLNDRKYTDIFYDFYEHLI